VASVPGLGPLEREVVTGVVERSCQCHNMVVANRIPWTWLTVSTISLGRFEGEPELWQDPAILTNLLSNCLECLSGSWMLNPEGKKDQDNYWRVHVI